MKVHINSNKINYKEENYLKPELIYIPLENKNNVKYKCLVKEGDYICKGQKVALNEKINLPIHSSVSGYVKGIIKKLINNGNSVDCITIENDYKEKIEKSKIKDNKDISKEEFIELLRENGITGMGGSDYPTFLKYNNDNIKYLLVNGVECEPFISCDKSIMYNHPEEILEVINSIMNIINIQNAYITVKKDSYKVINSLKKYLGTYPKIKLSLVENIYPNGWERLVVKNTLGIEYDKYPIEKQIVVSNVSTIYAIYEALKYNKPVAERVITIIGPGVKKECNIKVKIGTLASDIIKSIDGYKNIKSPLFIVGGPMMGKSIPSDDVVITKDVNAIMVINNDFEDMLPCISCGKCAMVCPVNLKPVLIMKNIEKKRLKYLDPNRCIECGLCSYICPSKIEVREYVKTAKEKVNK